MNSFVHWHAMLMVCFKANVLLRTIKCLIFKQMWENQEIQSKSAAILWQEGL